MKHSLLFILLLISTIVLAKKHEDIDLEKDSSIIKYTVVEPLPFNDIKIKSLVNMLDYKIDAFEKTTKELRNQSNGFKKGFDGIFEIGGGYGITDIELNSLKVNVIGSYRFNPFFSVGIGTGYRRFYNYNFDFGPSAIPIFGDVRFNFLNKPISPFVAVSSGYLFNTSDDVIKYKLLINTSIGVTVKTTEKINLIFGLSYDFQHFTTPRISYENEVLPSWQYYLHMLGINVGVSF